MADTVIEPLPGRPSDRSVGQLAMIFTTGGTTDSRNATPLLMYSDGVNWRTMVGNVFNG